MIRLLFIASLCTTFFSSKCQSGSLSIGDSVPEINFTLLRDSNNIRLSQLRGKLIILDFWATWCGSCRGGFVKADSLQKMFDNKIQIILVNSSNRTKADTKEQVDKFYERWKIKYPNFSLPIAINDTTAFKLFKHSGIPHYVWITPEGSVGAITSRQHVTAENIDKFLSGNYPQLPIKRRRTVH